MNCALALDICHDEKKKTRLEFSCENLAFLFLNKKARLEITSGPNETPYERQCDVITFIHRCGVPYESKSTDF